VVRKLDPKQILAWKQRRGEPRIGIELTSSIEALQGLWDTRSDKSEYLAEFIPIRLVATIEAFVREAVREIVDEGPSFLERAEKLAKGAKIDFVFAHDLEG
jgi:hypothetical protein